ncbi:MAG: dipeptidase [Deltaproteobacteria bacterium]|nr:dipeptidase [Deltaproteobacteria bacterium]
MQNSVLEYIEKNRERHLEELKNIIKIPSISTQPDKKPAVLKAADFELAHFKAVGLENCQLLKTTGNPLVYGDWLHAADKPTILIYGHYDVQPPDPLDQWKSPPFEPTIRDGNLYARGATDDKGQYSTFLFAIEAWLKTAGKLPINIKIVLEGEEECGSTGIAKYVPEHADFFKCDAMMVADMPWLDENRPAISYSLKGLVYFEIAVKGSSHDLHSGLYGGMVTNPLQALSQILAKLKDNNGKILIPNFYDDVLPMTADEKKEIAGLDFDEKTTAKYLGVKELFSEKDFSPLEANWTRPTLDICGMWGGYTGVGSKTIIPAEAHAKVSIRLVPNQDPQKVQKSFGDYVRSLCPPGVSVAVDNHSGGWPVHIERDNAFLKAAASAYEKGFGKKLVFKREGASIPVVATFKSVLKVPMILVGLGLPDDGYHSPNEKINLSHFYGGIKGAALAFEALAETK